MPLVKLLPDIEILLVNWLPGPLAAGLAAIGINAEPRVMQSVPLKIDGLVVRVTRAAGTSRNHFTDRPIVDLDAFCPDFDTAAAASRVIQNVLSQLRGTPTPDGTVQGVITILGPHWLPDVNQNLTRYSGSYEISCH